MLVSHRHRFIYTKTMKTAGTSVEAYFEPFCMPEGEWTPSSNRDETVSASGIVGFRGGGRPEGCRWWNHMPAAKIREQLDADAWNGYFKFCVVRDPFDKLISMFYFMRRNGLVAIPHEGTDREQFGRWLQTARFPRDDAAYRIDDEVCMDRFVRYENLAGDLEQVCRHLSLPWDPARLPTLKSGIRPEDATVERMYGPESVDFVAAAFRDELDLFGYRVPQVRR